MSERGIIGVYRSIAGLLAGATFLFCGQGVFLIFAPLQLSLSGASDQAISLIGAAYFAGIMSGAWCNDRVIRAVGHVRAYSGFLALIIGAALSLSLITAGPAWAASRFVHGWAAAGAFLAIESWLHAATPNRWRGRLVGSYTALSLAALGVGQLLVDPPGQGGPVDIGTLFLCMAIVPVVLSRARGPEITIQPRRPLYKLYSRGPIAAVASLFSGLLLGAFWSLGPAVAQVDGSPGAAASAFMASAVFGGFSLVWILGRLSDWLGRAAVIASTSALAAAASLVCLTAGAASSQAGLVAIAVYGGVLFSLYPLAVSLAADGLELDMDMLETTRSLLLVHGAGMIAGPLLAAPAVAQWRDAGFFLFSASGAGLLCIVMAAAMIIGRANAARPRKAFIPVRVSTPAALPLDPRVTDPQGELDLDDAGGGSGDPHAA
jgi:MFS family permease